MGGSEPLGALWQRRWNQWTKSLRCVTFACMWPYPQLAVKGFVNFLIDTGDPTVIHPADGLDPLLNSWRMLYDPRKGIIEIAYG